MSQPIDPDRIPDLMKHLFNEAAKSCSGPGRVVFETLSSTFNQLKEAIETNAGRERVLLANRAYEIAMLEAHAVARLDRDTFDTLRGIYETVDKAKRGEYIPVQKKPQQRRPGKSGQCHV